MNSRDRLIADNIAGKVSPILVYSDNYSEIVSEGVLIRQCESIRERSFQEELSMSYKNMTGKTSVVKFKIRLLTLNQLIGTIAWLNKYTENLIAQEYIQALSLEIERSDWITQILAPESLGS